MNHTRTALFLALIFAILASRVADARTWSRTYGGGGQEQAKTLRLLPDGGISVFGQTTSFGAAGLDVWLFEVGPDGAVRSEEIVTLGRVDTIARVVEASDGGFLVVGGSSASGGPSDAHLMKIGADGALEWQRLYGGIDDDLAADVHELPGGGYLLAGSFTDSATLMTDAWLLRLDEAGQILWQKTYGGSADDAFRSVVPLGGQEFLVSGTTSSTGPGGPDLWLLAVDEQGSITWEQTYGGPGVDSGGGLLPLPGGGWVMVGVTTSFGAGTFDFWVVRLDAAAEIVWERAYGGDDVDALWMSSAPGDGTILLGGRTESFGSIVPEGFFLVLSEANGDVLLQKTYGGGGSEVVSSALPTGAGGWLIGGWTDSYGSGGGRDLWLMRVDRQGEIDPGCPVVHGSSVVVTDTQASVRPFTSTVGETSVTPANVPLTSTPTSAVFDEQCLGACTPLVCDRIDFTPDPACAGEAQQLTARTSGGEPPLTISWDWEGDAQPEAEGNPVDPGLAAGSYDVTATVEDSCPDPAPDTCELATTVSVLAPPSEEVSWVEAGAPPLRVPRPGEVRVENLDGAEAYNVHADRLGSWYEPSPATGSVCHIDTWTDNGDGTITLDYDAPGPATWFLVTASNPCGEGPVGTDSEGGDRLATGTWNLCGAVP